MRLKSKTADLGAPRKLLEAPGAAKGRKSPTSRPDHAAKRLRILLVDDHAMLRDTLRRQLDADPAFQVVATADDLESARAAVDSSRPDVILLDIQLGPESGLDAIGFMRRARPGARSIKVSMFDQSIYRDRAFELGADAYVTKGASLEALRQLLLADDAGAAEADSDRIWRRPGQLQSLRMTLSDRELQVIHALATGKREKEVAEELAISVSSVGTYLKRSMAKVGVATRAELFRHAGALGVQSNSDRNGGKPANGGTETWKP